METKRGLKFLKLAPRSHAKSSCTSVVFPSWLIGKNPNIRLLICSNTQSQANLFVGENKANIEGNDKYIEIFGNLKPDDPSKWTQSEFTVKRTRILKDATLLGLGVGSAIIARRADGIIIDDAVDQENSATELQRKKLKTWFWKTLFPVLEPHGFVIFIGTRWHYDDLYNDLLENPDFDREVLKAVINEEKKEVLWSERWSYDKLMEIKRNAGSIIFNCQYQNDPSGMKGRIFNVDWFKYYEVIDWKSLKLFMAIDPAISEALDADYFALCVIGIDSEGKVYILDMFRGHLTLHAQVEKIFEYWLKYDGKITKVGIETVAYQKALKQEIDRISAKTNQYVPTKELQADKDKVRRAIQLSSVFENGLIFFRKDWTYLYDELLQFPDAKHDDMVDALGYAIQLSREAGKYEVLPALENW